MRGEVSRALEAARKQGKIGKGVDAVVYVPSAPEEQWRPAARRQGRGAARDALQRLGACGSRERPPADAGVAYESQDIPGLVLEVAARPGARLEEVRALLDLEPAASARTPSTRRSASAAAGRPRAPPVTLVAVRWAGSS